MTERYDSDPATGCGILVVLLGLVVLFLVVVGAVTVVGWIL